MPIQILSPEIQQRIAAGEVIDRPASAVKELIENAIDAAARAIVVSLRSGGLDMIRISDDGCGIPRNQAALALERFSTSKIATLTDLEQIRTLGFRGEALSSIAAAAQVDILTRAADELQGTRVRAQEGQVTVEPAASPVGSSITVSGLFRRLPARRRFLKSPIRETELVQQTVVRYALAYPQIAFRLIVDERERLIAPPGTLLTRIGDLLGREVAQEMIPVGYQAVDLRIEGYISRPTIGRSRRSDQYWIINGRPVHSGLLTVMLERPFAGRLPPGRYPLSVLHITLDPRCLDVNVHPQKAQVRLAQERAVYGALTEAVRAALSEYPARTDWPTSTGEPWTAPPGALYEAATPFAADGPRALAQLHRTYILAQDDAGLIIADQHAAHEQALFEQLWRGDRRVSLSPPAQLGLTAAEMTVLERAATALDTLGIEIEAFGRSNVLIRTLPAALQGQDAAALLTALLAEAAHADDIGHAITLKAACLGAVKAGDTLSLEQMQQILDNLAETWSPATCPHGRPALVHIGRDELDRRFGRA